MKSKILLLMLQKVNTKTAFCIFNFHILYNPNIYWINFIREICKPTVSELKETFVLYKKYKFISSTSSHEDIWQIYSGLQNLGGGGVFSEMTKVKIGILFFIFACFCIVTCEEKPEKDVKSRFEHLKEKLLNLNTD